MLGFALRGWLESCCLFVYLSAWRGGGGRFERDGRSCRARRAFSLLVGHRDCEGLEGMMVVL